MTTLERKAAWRTKLSVHTDREMCLKGEDPRFVSFLAGRAAIAGLEPTDRMVDWVAHYAFIIDFGPTEACAAAADEQHEVPGARVARHREGLEVA